MSQEHHYPFEPNTMKELTNQLRFTRIDSDDIYYTDLAISLINSVKFDIFNSEDQIATLVTNNKKMFSLSNDNSRLSMKRKSGLLNKWKYFIYKSETTVVGTICINIPIIPFVERTFNITFSDTNAIYVLTKRKKKNWKYKDADFHYDFTLNGQTKCSIINMRREKNIFILKTTAKQEGLIEYDSSLSVEKLLCLLQFVNIHIEIENSD